MSALHDARGTCADCGARRAALVVVLDRRRKEHALCFRCWRHETVVPLATSTRPAPLDAVQLVLVEDA